MTVEYHSPSQPDILEVIADLSNDEVRTPPSVANAVLDLLPEEVWTNPELRWLDPGAKTGVFLREVTKRLMVGLEAAIPDEKQRLTHILQEQVFGIAITELTALMARRTLYCSKDAAGSRSVVSMPTSAGNIWFGRTRHLFAKGRCSICGATDEKFDSETGENYAYAFIHEDGRLRYQEDHEMKFDVIVGNPPYQMDDTSDSPSASPLYNKFVEHAISLGPSYIAMIIPSRWMGGGKGLDSFRDLLLKSNKISKLVDYFNAAELFPQVGINGGVCYFLWDASHQGAASVETFRGGDRIGPMARDLHEHEIFIRDPRVADIVRKVSTKESQNFSSIVSVLRPFGLRTYETGSDVQTGKGQVQLYRRGGIGFIDKKLLTDPNNSIEQWKVFLLAVGSGRERETAAHDVVYFRPILAGPGTACTETYLSIGPFGSEASANSALSYLKTKFVRFLVSSRKSGQHINRGLFSFVPFQNWDEEWTDTKLFDLYSLTEREIALIESTIKEFEG